MDSTRCGGRYRILCFGDSNTYGYDPRSYLGSRYPETVRWTGILNAEPDWEIRNLGENGREIPRRSGETALAAEAVERAGRLDGLIVMLGGNDLLQDPELTAEGVAARMERFLHCLTERPSMGGVKVLLTAPPPMRRGAWVEEVRLLRESARLPRCYRDLALRMGLSFADAGAWEIELAFDGVHFSEAGHRTFARHMEAVLKRMFTS